ncbi:MAG: hypothetical protein Q8Q12_08390 [bacterium]|nr:hypothetical protein [bacterium]
MDKASSVFERLTHFVKRVFKTTLEVFFEALKLSPNAQGYVAGSITELLLKEKLEREHEAEVKRIREKWEGRKLAAHHGDFYFKEPRRGLWFVMECKGLKSNSEKWHKLYNYANLKNFMISHADTIHWVDRSREVEPQISAWVRDNLPKFAAEYAQNLYEYEEVRRYHENVPTRKTEKSAAMEAIGSLSRREINGLIEQRLEYLMARLAVLETHFVSGTSASGQRTQATPRADEFNIVSVDIYLRYTDHKFLFANPKLLEPSSDDPNHLQQNYVIGFVFGDEHGTKQLSIGQEWSDDFEEVYKTVNSKDCVKEEDMQVDDRRVVLEEWEE